MTLEGRVIGSYRIEARLGSDFGGHVYRATRITDGQPAAVKIFPPRYAADSTLHEDLTQDVENVRELQHPNVLEILEFGEESGQLFVAMDLCPHGSMRTLLKRAAGTGQPIPFELVIGLMHQAALGLGFAQESGMVHGNVKPENLLLKSAPHASSSAHWVVKVADFGLAGGVTEEEGSQRRHGPYASPEERDGAKPDRRSDVYALGVILGETVSGRPADVLPTIEKATEQDTLASPQVQLATVPDELRSVVLRCLASTPDERYDSASELAAALGAIELSSPSHLSASGESSNLSSSLMMSVDDRVKLSDDGSSALELTIANRSDQGRDVQVDVEATSVARFSDLPRLLRLEAGQEKSISIQVRPSMTSAVSPGEYRVRLHVHDKLDETADLDAVVTLVVAPATQARLNLSPLGKVDGRQAVFQVEIINDGTVTEHFSLEAGDEERNLRYRFRPEMVSVEPGRPRTIMLTVQDRRRESRPDRVEFHVRAVPSHGPPAVVYGEFARESTREYGVRQVMVGFGALGVVAVVIVVMLMGSLIHGSSPKSVAVARTPTALPTPQPTLTPTLAPTEAQPTPTPTVTPATDLPIVVKRVDTTTRQVALTFSIGNDPSAAAKIESILKILRDRNVLASFGVSGDWAAANPDAVKAIMDGGHQIINETYDQKSFTGSSDSDAVLTSDARILELTRADEIIKQITGSSTEPYYRPPFGDIDSGPNSTVEQDARQAGYSVAVLWSIDTKSWLSSQSVGTMISVASDAEPGDIVLFNITTAGGTKDVSALPQIIDNLHGRGFDFATIKQLVGR